MNPTVILATKDRRCAQACTALFAATVNAVVFYAETPEGLDAFYSVLDSDRIYAIIVTDSALYDEDGDLTFGYAVVDRISSDIACGKPQDMLRETYDDFDEICRQFADIVHRAAMTRMSGQLPQVA